MHVRVHLRCFTAMLNRGLSSSTGVSKRDLVGSCRQEDKLAELSNEWDSRNCGTKLNFNSGLNDGYFNEVIGQTIAQRNEITNQWISSVQRTSQQINELMDFD